MIFSIFKEKEPGKLSNIGKLNTSNEPKLTKREKYILASSIILFLVVPIILTWVITKKVYSQNINSQVVVQESITVSSIEEEIVDLIKSIESEQLIISSKLDNLEKLAGKKLQTLSSQLDLIKKEETFIKLNKKMNDLDNEIKKSNVYVKKVEEIKKVNQEINTLLESYKLEINK
jgi:predicted patatin/cPLA2 family phospholipase